jgi:TolB-like protein
LPSLVRFEGFELDFDSRRLRKRGLPIKLSYQCFQVLACLLEHPGCAVTREDLHRRLWRDEVFVDFDNNLNILIARLREVLCDSAEHPRFIETLPRYGYRFIGDVQRVQPLAEPASATRSRLLVLPFINLSGDAAQEYFSDAVTDEIITAVAGVGPDVLAVIARTTAMHYKGSHKDVGRIGRELNLDYVVEGGVRRDGEQVGINVQLIEPSDQAHVFAKKYDADMRDIFSVYGCIAQAVAAHIPAIAQSTRAGGIPEGAAKKKPTEDVVAYNLYLQGRYRIFTDVLSAKDYFEKVIVRDPRFALAYDGLGGCYWWIGFVGLMSPRDAFSAGLWAALRAIEIDSTLAETHALLGQFRKVPDYNWAEVQREMDLALELNPVSATVRLRRALSWLLPMGRLDEAAAELETALELDPMDLSMRSWLGVMHWLARQYDRAEEVVRLLLQIDPKSVWAYDLLGEIRCQQCKFEEAVAAFRRGDELSGSPRAFTGVAWLGFALARSGNVAEARALLSRLQVRAEHAYVPACCFAWTHFGLGEIDETFVWLDRAIDEFDPMIVPIKSYPFLDPIRSDPRFAALLRKMNLAP